MDLYDRLVQSSGSISTSDDENAESDMPELREYVVCVRHSTEAQLSDWVPVSCVALKWLGGSVANNPLLQGVADHRLAMPAAVRELRREIWECACQSAPSLQKLPRAAVEYAFEPLDDFSDVLEHAKSRGSSVSDAYAALGLERGSTPRDVKAAHRKLIMAHHPDTLVGKPDEERAAAEKRFQEVQKAYEVLGGGSGDAVGSWYENLGGKARADKFSGVLELSGAVELPELWEAAVCPIDADLAKDFMARNVMRTER